MAANSSSFDVCIVGAGVAGASMAAYLGTYGIKVVVVERTFVEQDRIVGELLQPGGVSMLEQMNLGHLLEGFDAQTMLGYALFLNQEHFKVEYPETHTGRGFRNGKFIEILRNYIRQLPSVTMVEGSVTDFIETQSIEGVYYTDKKSGETHEIRAALTVVCDGAFSSLRAKLSLPESKVTSHFLGMILKDCSLPYPGHGHVIIADPSPVLCYPITSTETRMLIDFVGDVPPKKGEELTAYLVNKIGIQLPESIQSSYFAAVAEGKFKVMPNHFLPAKPLLKQGAVLVGDSLNMRHPLTGGGMTVALTDVYELGTRILAMETLSAVEELNEEVREYYEMRASKVDTINILADALYGVMKEGDLKQACYTYLEKGGENTVESIAILSAVSRDRLLLLKHFFGVAFNGAKSALLPYPTPSKVKRSYQLIANSVKILAPLVRI